MIITFHILLLSIIFNTYIYTWNERNERQSMEGSISMYE